MLRTQTLINAIDAAINRIEAMMPTNRPSYEPELNIINELERYKRNLVTLKGSIISNRQDIVDEINTLQGAYRDKIQHDLELDDKAAKKEIKDINVAIDKIQQNWYLVDGVLSRRITILPHN